MVLVVLLLTFEACRSWRPESFQNQSSSLSTLHSDCYRDVRQNQICQM